LLDEKSGESWISNVVKMCNCVSTLNAHINVMWLSGKLLVFVKAVDKLVRNLAYNSQILDKKKNI